MDFPTVIKAWKANARVKKNQKAGTQGTISNTHNGQLNAENRLMALTGANTAHENAVYFAPENSRRTSVQFPQRSPPQHYDNVFIPNQGSFYRSPTGGSLPPRPRSSGDAHGHDRSARPSSRSPPIVSGSEELRKFHAYLVDIGDTYPQLKIRREPTLQGMVERLRVGYQDSQKEIHEMNREIQDMVDMTTQHREEMSMLAEWKNDNESMRKQIKKLQKDIFEEKETVKSLRGKILRLETEKMEAVGKGRRDLDKAQSEHRMEMRKEKEKWQSGSSSLKTDNERLKSEMKSLRKNLEFKIQTAREEVDTRWQLDQAAFEQRHREAYESLKEVCDGLNEQMRMQTDGIEAQKQSQLEGFQLERQIWQENAKAREVQIDLNYQNQLANMALELENLKGELTNREHIDGLTDPELAEQFELLANAVREVSRVRWDKSNEQYWPYAENVIERVQNPRKLKQQIVQASVWTILFEKIFYSPFQVFADEGAKMHGEWTKTYGQDSYAKEFKHWPHPTPKSEAWRYQRIKNCVQALEQMGSGSLEMQRCKDGYDSSRIGASREISRAIEKLCFVDDSKQRTIQSLVNQAAKFWLDVCSEHYRVLVVLPQSTGNLLQGPKPSYGPIRLVINPKLQRIGNSVGEALDKVETVGKWDGLIEPYDLY